MSVFGVGAEREFELVKGRREEGEREGEREGEGEGEEEEGREGEREEEGEGEREGEREEGGGGLWAFGGTVKGLYFVAETATEWEGRGRESRDESKLLLRCSLRSGRWDERSAKRRYISSL